MYTLDNTLLAHTIIASMVALSALRKEQNRPPTHELGHE